MRIARWFLLALTLALAMRAQSPVSFEVASVKPNRSADSHGASYDILPGGRLVVRNMVLGLIVADAYGVGVQSPRLAGTKDWMRLRGERFDIEAVAPKDSIPGGPADPVLRAKVHAMLRTLLADRFKMVVRRETKVLPVYAVVVATNGPKLAEGSIEEKDCAGMIVNGRPGCHMVVGGIGRGIYAEAATIADVAQFVENWSDRPVIDETGITGLFQFHTEGWSPMRPTPPHDGNSKGGDADLLDPTRPTLFSVFEKLGLKIESKKAPVEVFTIDHIELPAANE